MRVHECFFYFLPWLRRKLCIFEEKQFTYSKKPFLNTLHLDLYIGFNVVQSYDIFNYASQLQKIRRRFENKRNKIDAIKNIKSLFYIISTKVILPHSYYETFCVKQTWLQRILSDIIYNALAAMTYEVKKLYMKCCQTDLFEKSPFI